MKPLLATAGEEASAFLSFSMRDKVLVASFKAAITRRLPSLILLEHPVRDLYDESWQSHCGKKIDRSTMIICLIGESTYLSKAVAWEISRGVSLGKPVIAVDLIDDSPPLPEVLKKNSIAPIHGSNDITFSYAAQLIEAAYS